MTTRQVRFIKKLAKQHDVTKVADHLKQALDAALFGKEELIPSMMASQIIDSLLAAPLVDKVPSEPGEKKVPGFWKRPEVVEVLQQVAGGTLNAWDAAKQLDAKVTRVRRYTSLLSEGQKIYDPNYSEAAAREERKANVLIDLKARDFDSLSINWAKFFGLEQMERFDLRRVCAMFYASERLVTVKTCPPELYQLKRRAYEYVQTWAQRFGKYTLAACLGEFRNRKISGKLKIVPRGRKRDRAAAQAAAEILWPDRDKVARAAEWMVEKFSDPRYFSGPFGGPKWSKIAKTFLSWHLEQVPDVVFADYVWDLSHNGGMFFNKCPLFEHERDAMALHDRRRASKTLDVIPWAGDFLHPDWKSGLDLLEVANMPGPEEA